MDPLTRAAESFCRQLGEGWRRAPIVRLVAPAQHRSHLVGSLRLFEWAPDNRWPVCLVEAPADDLGELAEAARRQLLADLARLRKGLADDGITLADPAAFAPEPAPGLTSMAQLQHLADRAGEALARTGVVGGLALVFVPAATPDPKVLRRLAVTFAAWPERPHVRAALAATEHADVLPVAVRFELDDGALHDYCGQQSERQAAGAPPAEASLRRQFLTAADAARRNDLAAARDAYLTAAAELESQRRLVEAAVVHITLGGLAFGLADHRAALDHFDRALAHSADARQPAVLVQAHLGAAGVLFARGELAAAAARYELAASGGATEVLRIEALRMAGTCHLELGDRNAAARAWQSAVTDASGLASAARAQTTWKQAGEALLAQLQRSGQTAQVAHLRALLQAE